MNDIDGRRIARRHDHPHAEPGDVEQAFGEVERHPDAAVRCRISRQNAAVQRDAGPGYALHVWHKRVVIKVGIMLGILLDDAEDAGRCLASPLAARYRRPEDPAIGVVHDDPLVAQRNDGEDRLARLTRLDDLDGARVLRRLPVAPA